MGSYLWIEFVILCDVTKSLVHEGGFVRALLACPLVSALLRHFLLVQESHTPCKQWPWTVSRIWWNSDHSIWSTPCSKALSLRERERERERERSQLSHNVFDDITIRYCSRVPDADSSIAEYTCTRTFQVEKSYLYSGFLLTSCI